MEEERTTIPAGIVAEGAYVTSSLTAEEQELKHENYKLDELDIFKVTKSVDNALIHDFYANEEVTGSLSEEEKKTKLENLNSFVQQSAGITSLGSSSGFSIDTKDTLEKTKEEFERKENKNDLEQLITKQKWLHIRMPEEFNYTCAILLNHLRNGLYHSVIRHHDEWRHFILNFQTELQHPNFNDLQSYLQEVSGAYNHFKAGEAINKYRERLSELRQSDPQKFLDVQSSLFDLQLDLYSFIQANVTYENYLGEGVTANNKVRVFFKVKDFHGNIKAMAVGVSSDIYAPDNDFGDDRPIRRIETAFIMPWGKYEEQKLSKLFDKENFLFKN